jgi:hypothetical protein
MPAIALSGCDLPGGWLHPKNLAKQKHVGKQRTQMDRCVQVIDQLRADRWLREHEFNGGTRI